MVQPQCIAGRAVMIPQNRTAGAGSIARVAGLVVMGQKRRIPLNRVVPTKVSFLQSLIR